MTSDELFYTDLDGKPAMLVDLIDDGLEGDYDDRIPALRELLANGTDEEQLNAARMLVAWSDPAGFEALIAWAASPDDAPGAAVNRMTGGDATFARLADALRAGRYGVRAEAHESDRVDAVRGLLALADTRDFERDLSGALTSDPALRQRVFHELVAAAERAVERLQDGDKPGFDLWTQAASLLLPLAKEDDAIAAELASRLIALGPKYSRMLRELIDAMRAGRGPATLAVLGRLRESRDPTVREEADAAIARRTA